MGLTAGAAKACITPPLGTSLAGYFTDRKAVDIHDDLYAKALIVDDGSDAVALVVCDMICCPREVLDRAKEIAHARLGIPPPGGSGSCPLVAH